MTLPPFELERFFAKYEFEVVVNLCASDMESVRMHELVAHADAEGRALWDELSLGYTESLGHKQLRDEIARWYELTRDDVLVFSGAQEAIYAWARATLGPADHVVCVWPAYQSLYTVAREQGAQVSLFRLRPEDEWRIDVDALIGALVSGVTALVINVPHNPTGAHLDRASFERLARACDERAITLVCDEVYRFLEHEVDATLPGAAALSARALSIGVLSKAFGLAGLRIGWIATRDRARLQQIAAYKDYTTICASAPSEVLAIMALRQRERLIARNRDIVLANLAKARAFFAAHAGTLSWIEPRAGCVAIARLEAGAPFADATALADHAAQKHGVLVMPAKVFERPGREFRVGLGRSNCADGFTRLSDALRSRSR